MYIRITSIEKARFYALDSNIFVNILCHLKYWDLSSRMKNRREVTCYYTIWSIPLIYYLKYGIMIGSLSTDSSCLWYSVLPIPWLKGNLKDFQQRKLGGKRALNLGFRGAGLNGRTGLYGGTGLYGRRRFSV